jgi:ATP-dependent Lhr-like helicase
MTDSSALIAFHPVVRSWFEKAFGEPSPPQRLGWPQIASRKSTLIVAPTGSGKTLAAFLWCINHLIEEDIAVGHIGESEEPQTLKGSDSSPRKKKSHGMAILIGESGFSISRR